MSALKPNQIFLSRAGKVFGPYTDEQIDSLRKSGELMDYAWIWDSAASRWNTIHQEPPPPAIQNTAVVMERAIQAVCFTSENLMGGAIESADSEGFAIYCDTSFEGLGPFKKGQTVQVSLVDDSSGQSENLTAVVSGCKREDRGIHYRFAWQQIPAILSQRSQSQASNAR